MPSLPDHLKSPPLGREWVSREVLAEHQRDRVLEAATGVFARRGYQATTVDDLLAAGKIGVGNFYSLFAGKEDCFLATFDAITARARGRIAAAAAPAETWSERAVRGLHELVSLLVADQSAARIVLIEAQAAGPQGTQRYEALLDAATEWLHAGRAALSKEALPPTFERSAIAGLAYYLQQCLFGAGALDADELFSEVSLVILEPVVGADELRRLRDAVLNL